MSKFDDIKDGPSLGFDPGTGRVLEPDPKKPGDSKPSVYGLIYTCKCGWIDLGHANPVSKDATQGAQNLWNAINNETGKRSKNGLWHRVDLSMTQAKFGLKTGIKDGFFAVRLGLTKAEKQSVAFTIFLDISHKFESYQGIFGIGTDSSYSPEDLISNVIGFYRAVDPSTDYVKLCQPVSKAAAQRIWEGYGAVGRSINKTKTTKPVLFPCSECPDGPRSRRQVPIPAFLDTIKPSPFGTNHRAWNETDPALTEVPPAAPAVPKPKEDKKVEAAEEREVHNGDTLSGFAATLYHNWELWPLLWDANLKAVGENPNRLKLGTKLTIPPLASFQPEKIEDAKRRAPTWKNYRF